MPDRLQKILATAGLASRRTAEVWIREGRVAVDGQIITELGTQADPAKERITVDGRLIPRPPKRLSYIALNKPRGVTCTVADRHAQQTIVELVDLPGKPALKPVGRLDANSEGLIFLSDDGDFIYRLTHPRYHVQKTYLVTVRGEPSQDALGRLLRGIELDDGRTAPADGVRLVRRFPDNDTTDIEIIIHEGRKRQVRRMCDAIGHTVLRLVRTRIGAVTMGGLPAGAWRHLTATEIERLIKPDDEAVIVEADASRAPTKPASPKKPVSPANRAGAPRRAPVRGKRTPPSQKGRTNDHGK